MSKGGKNKGILLSKVELAHYFGVTRPTVDDWVRSGCPVAQKGNRRTPWQFNSADVYAWRLRQAEEGSEDYKGRPFEELRKEKIGAEIERLRFMTARDKKEFVDLKVTEKILAKAILDIRTRMMHLPLEIVPKIEMSRSKAKKKEILEDAINTVFKEIIDRQEAFFHDAEY